VATRAQRAPLTLTLPGSRLGARRMAVPAGGVGGRVGGQPVTGGAESNARVAARRVPQVQRRSCQGDRSESPERAAPLLRPPLRAMCRSDDMPSAARRALRTPLKPRTESCHGRTGERFTSRRPISCALNRCDTAQRTGLGAYRA
jgi:hypothetical protein